MDNSLSSFDPFESKPKKKLAPIGARMGFFDDFEIGEVVAEAPSQIIKAGAGIFGDLIDLFKNDIIGGGQESSSDKKPGMSIGGKTELNFNQAADMEKKEEAVYKKDFYQKLEADRKNLEYKDLEQTMEDLARLEVGAMSTEEKNKELHLSADLDEKNIRDPYHLHALRKKKLEQIKEAWQEQKDAAMVTAGPNLTMRLDANEGQSMVSQSGAIMSAG